MNWSYLAGLIDGEGSIDCNPEGNHGHLRVGIRISNTNRQVLEETRTFLGCAGICRQPDTGTFKQQKPCYMFYVAGWRNILRICEGIQSDSIIKHDKVNKTIALIKNNSWRYHRLELPTFPRL